MLEEYYYDIIAYYYEGRLNSFEKYVFSFPEITAEFKLRGGRIPNPKGSLGFFEFVGIEDVY